MKILLLGEYSRLHNSLKEGLTTLGHEVIIVGTGDSFKKFNTDYSIYPKLFNDYWFLRKFKNLIYKLSGYNLEETEKGYRFNKLLHKLKGFDHIQLINSDAIETQPKQALKLYKKLLKQNRQMSLLICGDDTPIIEYCLNGDLKYSILTPYLQKKAPANYFKYSLKYLKPNYKKLFEWVKNNSVCIVTSDLDYEIPMKAMGYETHFIPNPINTDTITYNQPEITDKIIIFLGINRLSYIKKGINFFEEALTIIQEKYRDKVEIIITENVPYNEYIKLYDRAHILLDQTYGYDQGYNALEAMAKGKVVFTGAETEFTQQYNLTERVAINALPDTKAIVNELSYLIENPNEIKAISLRARVFIEKEHNYIKIAEKYIEVWST
ncbi:glycosyltransferase [Flavobacterium beibuense]|uniref:Putative glycosyl transferase WbsE n=1 Tax=Flavobacterium beibuense TaxID=657326 RepID=A0A444W7K6_9FLAO|nr:glycosyltransferase [Flavobacterium beibuense]RYJ41861.1 putative glycosyl transferase WbsE [Flavobacterium beibuense]